MSDDPQPTEDAPGEERPGALQAVGDGMAVVGRLLGRAAVGLGTSLAQAYHALDPDLRRHLAQMPLVGLTHLVRGRPAIEARPDDGHPVVLMVHGFGGQRGNFLPMQGYFRWKGRTRSFSVGFEETNAPAAMADELRVFIAEIAEVHDLAEDDSIDLVAHSMGGLICRVALEDPAVARRVRHLVTLGTPHSGTFAARFAGTGSAHALRPGSDLVVRLAAQLPWTGPPALPPITALWSGSDVLLLPAEAAKLEGADNLEMEGFTHLSYLLHPASWAAVLGVLEG